MSENKKFLIISVNLNPKCQVPNPKIAFYQNTLTKLAYKKFKAYNKVKVGSINSYIVNLFTGSNFFPYFDQFKNERLQANEDALIYDEPMNRQGRDN